MHTKILYIQTSGPISVLIEHASSESSNKPAHFCKLARGFAAFCTLKVLAYKKAQDTYCIQLTLCMLGNFTCFFGRLPISNHLVA